MRMLFIGTERDQCQQRLRTSSARCGHERFAATLVLRLLYSVDEGYGHGDCGVGLAVGRHQVQCITVNCPVHAAVLRFCPLSFSSISSPLYAHKRALVRRQACMRYGNRATNWGKRTSWLPQTGHNPSGYSLRHHEQGDLEAQRPFRCHHHTVLPVVATHQLFAVLAQTVRLELH